MKTIKETIDIDIKESMINKDSKRRDTLKFFKSEIERIEKDDSRKLTDNEVVLLLRKTIKNLELINREEEKEEVKLLEKYIPSMSKEEIVELSKKSLEKYPEKVEMFKNGNKGIIGLFMGDVMKSSGGLADPKETNKILQELLNE